MELQVIQSKIYEIRDYKVMLDRDLAEMYGVETRVLKQVVKRNIERFVDDDFMFELTEHEIDRMVSQIVIPSRSYFGGAKPYAFPPLPRDCIAWKSVIETLKLPHDTIVQQQRR